MLQKLKNLFEPFDQDFAIYVTCCWVFFVVAVGAFSWRLMLGFNIAFFFGVKWGTTSNVG